MTEGPKPRTAAGELTERVDFTVATDELLRQLVGRHGHVMFHQSGGCCDGSSPMCYPDGEFMVGGADVLLRRVPVEGLDAPVDFWMSASQFEYWRHTHLSVDVVDGRGGGFSLESPEGKRFLIRSEIFTDDEERHLAPVARGDEVDHLDR